MQIRRKADGKILVWKELDYGKMSEKEKHLLVSEVFATPHVKSSRWSLERKCTRCHYCIPPGARPYRHICRENTV